MMWSANSCTSEPRPFSTVTSMQLSSIQMHVQRRLRQVVMVVKPLGQALGQFAGVVVVDVDQRGDAKLREARRFDRGPVAVPARQIADRFGAVY